MKAIKLLRAGGGDWVGIYVDGKLVKEGHSIQEEDVIAILFPKMEIETVWGSEDLEEYGNRCPLEWNQVTKVP